MPRKSRKKSTDKRMVHVREVDKATVDNYEKERDKASDTTDRALDVKTKKRNDTVEAITERTAAGKPLTKSQEKDLDKSPAVRILVRKKLKQMDLDTGSMYCSLLADAYFASKGKRASGEALGLTEREKLDNRTLAMKHIQDFDGLKAQPEREDALPPNIHIHAHAGLALSINTNGTSDKIRTPSETADAPFYEKAGTFPPRDCGASVGEELQRGSGLVRDEPGVRRSPERGSDNGADVLDDREDRTPDHEATMA